MSKDKVDTRVTIQFMLKDIPYTNEVGIDYIRQLIDEKKLISLDEFEIVQVEFLKPIEWPKK